MKRPTLLPPVYFILSLGLVAAMHYWLPIYRLIEPPLTFCGLILIVIGMAISAFGAGQFRKVGTPVIPFEQSTTLVTTGLYGWTRNPMYLGMVIGLIGVAIVSGTVGALVPLLPFTALIDILFIRREERFLEGIFGDSYRVYKQSVRRWV